MILKNPWNAEDTSEYATGSIPEYLRAMRSLRQGSVFCYLLFLSATSHVVWQRFVFKYEQSVHMYNMYSICHMLLKSWNINLRKKSSSARAAGYAWGRYFISKTWWTWTLCCDRTIKIAGGSSHLMHLRQVRNIFICCTRKLSFYGVESL